jgi:hypothetical protein
MGMFEQRRDAAQALAVGAPAMQEHQMMRRRQPAHLIDQTGAVVFEPLDVNCVRRQGSES